MINVDEHETVGVGVGLDGHDLADHDFILLPPASRLDQARFFEPGKGQAVSQPGSGQGNINVFSQPRQRDKHLSFSG